VFELLPVNSQTGCQNFLPGKLHKTGILAGFSDNFVEAFPTILSEILQVKQYCPERAGC